VWVIYCQQLLGRRCGNQVKYRLDGVYMCVAGISGYLCIVCMCVIILEVE